MMYWKLLNGMIVIVVMAAIAAICPAAELRTWTSADGEFKVQAELLDVDDSEIRLRRSDGKEVVVPLAKICEQDRQYAKQAAKRVSSKSPRSLPGEDATRRIEHLGSPFAALYKGGEDIYSRNIWDMQVYDDRVFLGAGNSSNQGPSQNSGPVPIVAFDARQQRFVVEDRVAEEQIDIYKVYNDELVIPGHDTTKSWDLGNYYKRTTDNRWNMYRNIPDGLHVYDIVFMDGVWYSALGVPKNAAVGVSRDGGKTWTNQLLGKGSRVYGFLPIGNQLFAVKAFKRTKDPYLSLARLESDGTFQPIYDKSIYEMFPETRFEQEHSRAIRVTSFDGKALYIGAYKYNDHQTKPFGLYLATLHDRDFASKRVDLLDGSIPRDLLIREKKVFLLTGEDKGTCTVNKVFSSPLSNGEEWEEVLSFEYGTFARSFEYLNRAFYFGMGCDVADSENWNQDELLPETGDILRVKTQVLR